MLLLKVARPGDAEAEPKGAPTMFTLPNLIATLALFAITTLYKKLVIDEVTR